MSDQSFREIQLSGKQLVFLFMTSVVVVVAVFLLGVSVGRGVGANAGGVEAADQAASVGPPADLPPPTEVTPDDFLFHDTLQGVSTPPPEPEPEVPVAVVEEAADVSPAGPPPMAAVAATFPDEPPARPAPAPEAPTARAPAQGWFV